MTDRRLLSPPLKTVWVAQQAGAYGAQPSPFAVDDLIVLGGSKYVSFALARGSWEIRWHQGHRVEETIPTAIAGTDVIALCGPKSVERIDARTGATKQRYPWGISSSTQVVGDTLVSANIESIAAGDLLSGRLLWRLDTQGEPETCGTGSFIATPRAVVFGMRGGDVVCVDLHNGKELWRNSVADLAPDRFVGDDQRGVASGKMHAHRDRIIINVSERHLVCFSISNGRRMWTSQVTAAETLLIGDRLYVSPYKVIDVNSGEIIQSRWVGLPSALKKAGVGLTSGLAVSETHCFQTTNYGHLIAWERESTKVVWWCRLQGAAGGQNCSTLISDGRLYLADGSRKLFCLEEVTATDPVLRAERVAAAAAGRPFRFPTEPLEIREPTRTSMREGLAPTETVRARARPKRTSPPELRRPQRRSGKA